MRARVLWTARRQVLARLVVRRPLRQQRPRPLCQAQPDNLPRDPALRGAAQGRILVL